MNSAADVGAPALRHAAVRYPTAQEMTESVLEFVKAGVDDGEAVLIGSAGPILQRLRIQLGGHGEHVTWTGMASAGTNPRRITAAVRAFADEHRGQPIRCVQEPAWHLLTPAHLSEAIRHEALMNLALSGLPATVLCAYDTQLDDSAATSAERTHPMTFHDGRWQPSAVFAEDAPVPEECEVPLTAPPASAATLAYRDDLAAVRQFVTDRARLTGLAADRVTDLVIAVGELAANTLAHTSEPGMLWVWAAAGEVVCEIRDSGHITDPLTGSFLPDAAASGGGRGLWVVHQLCDLVETRNDLGGTTIRMHMHLVPRDEPPRRRRGGRPTSIARPPAG